MASPSFIVALISSIVMVIKHVCIKVTYFRYFDSMKGALLLF